MYSTADASLRVVSGVCMLENNKLMSCSIIYIKIQTFGLTTEQLYYIVLKRWLTSDTENETATEQNIQNH